MRLVSLAPYLRFAKIHAAETKRQVMRGAGKASFRTAGRMAWRFRILLVSVNCVAGFLQGIFLGQVHCRKLSISVMDGLGSPWMPYQGVIAFPKAVRQLMKLHFDFNAFVYGLNHSPTLRRRGSQVENKSGKTLVCRK
jgi:hypothetical protein